MKTKITRLSRRGISALLSVLMAVSCLTFALMSTSAAETQGSSVSASAQDDGTVSASANDGTVAAQSDDDTVAASADDSGTVSAQSEDKSVGDSSSFYLIGHIGNCKVSDLAYISGTTVTESDGVYTVTIPASILAANTNCYFALSSSSNSDAYKSMFAQGNKGATTSTDGSRIFSGYDTQSYNDNGTTYYYARVSFNAIPSDNITLTVTVDDNNVTYAFSYGGTITVPTYTVTAKTSTGGTICETSDGTYGTTDITLSGVSSDSPKQFYVKANDGYNFNGFTTDSGVNVTYSTGSDGVVTAKVTATAAGTVTANFKAKGGTTTGSNHYTATFGTKYSDDVTLDTSSVSATFYDYYTDSEITNGWRDISNGNAYNNWEPFTTLNSALSAYASSNNVTFPLYFGNFYNSSDNYNSYTNFYNKINNSQGLTDSHYAVTGLSGTTLTNGVISYYNASGENENGAEMILFNEDWLSGENSTEKELATIVDTTFPVRKTTYSETVSNTTLEDNYLYLDNTNDYNSDTTYYVAWVWGTNKDGKLVKLTNVSGNLWSYNLGSEDYSSAIFMRGSSDWYNGLTDGSSSWPTNNLGYNNNSGTVTIEYNKAWVITSSWKNNMTGSWDYPSTEYSTTYYTFDSTNATDNAWFSDYDSTTKTAKMNYGAGDNYRIKGNNSMAMRTSDVYGFFPFDDDDRGDNTSANDYQAMDYGFGVKLEVKFTLGTNGQILGTASDGTTKPVDQIFKYSGDDDLWVYVDGNLVLDLGGDHDCATGEINFAEKTVSVTTGQYSAGNLNSTTITRNGDFEIDNTNTNTIHTMTIYYMERGMIDSNLQFGYNFTAVGNGLNVNNTVDVSSVNASLQDTVKAAVSGTTTDGYDYSMSAGSDNTTYADKDTFKGKTSSESTTAYGDNEVTLVSGGSVDFVDQFTAKSDNTMYITQTLPSTAQAYKFLTSYTVTDTANSNQVSNSSSYTGTVNGVTTSDSKTGTFAFYTTKTGSISALDATTYEVAAINEVQTADLTIGKTINATDASDTDTFTFTVKIKLPSDNDYSAQTFTYYKDNTEYTADGGVVTLKNNETITIPGLPVNTEVKIVEDTSNAYALESITHTNWLSNDFTTDLDSNSATVALGADDSVTVTNHPLTYRVDFVVPTRLYNDKVYTYSDNVTSDMFETKDGDTQPYLIANSDGTYTFTKTYFTANCPYEEIFTKDITWSFEDTPASTNVTKTVTTGDENNRVETATTYDLYTYANLSESTARTVDVAIYDSKSDKGSNVAVYSDNGLEYGTMVYDSNNEWIDNSDNTSFLYWNIYKMNDSGSKADVNGDGSVNENDVVAVCHSQKFTYCLYEDYYVEAVYKTDSTSTDTNVTTAQNYVGATASYLDTTRSLWNDTTGGIDTTGLYNLANTTYDRIYIDFVLAFDYKNIRLNQYTGSDIAVGFKIMKSSDGGTTWETAKTITITDLTKLDQKNRIEYYYGINNSQNNRKLTLKITPFIKVNGTEVTSEETITSTGSFTVKDEGENSLMKDHTTMS